MGVRRANVVHASSQEALQARVRFFKGFTNGKRLQIIEVLSTGEKSVGQLVALTGISQAQVSNALGCLRWCGFVRRRRKGRQVRYSIASGYVPEILHLADLMVGEHVAQLYSCVVLAQEERPHEQG